MVEWCNVCEREKAVIVSTLIQINQMVNYWAKLKISLHLLHLNYKLIEQLSHHKIIELYQSAWKYNDANSSFKLPFIINIYFNGISLNSQYNHLALEEKYWKEQF